MTTRKPLVGRAQAATGRRSMVGRRGARVGSGARPARRRGPAGPSLAALLPLVFLPAVVTLGVTLLRLTGERLGWPPRFFSTLPGGGLAIVGITWLIPVVGFYLGDRLPRLRSAPGSLQRAAGLPLAALALVLILAAIATRAGFGDTPTRYLGVWGAASLVGMAVAWGGWPKLATLLFGYALAARLPVVLVMWLAMRGNWGTHYDALPPGFPPMIPSVLWLWTGLVPQMTIWVALTVIVGSLFGALAWHLAARRSA
jgi:hypothetical protein